MRGLHSREDRGTMCDRRTRLMQYAKFGNTGMTVSRICLGAMSFGPEMPEEEAIRAVHHALDAGVNFIDTADAYGRGVGEEILGKALAGLSRDDIVVATKFWVPMYHKPNAGGCSRRHILRAVEDSLRRLKTDYIDLYQLHHPDPNTPVEETLSTLDNLVKQGKIRYFGVSNHYAWQMAHMLGVSALHNWEPLVSIQCRYNIRDRAVEVETVPFCQEFNIAMITYSPQDRGVLTGKYERGKPIPADTFAGKSQFVQDMLTDETFHLLDELKKIAQKNDLGLNQLAVLWVLAKPFVTAPIVGGTKLEHFEQIYTIADRKLPDEDVETIDKLSEKYVHAPFLNQFVLGHKSLAKNWW